MENEELIFILNTTELKDAGFEGSFNDFAEELESAGATVSGEYDEDGAPVMTVYGIEQDELNQLLSDYGVEEPEVYTEEVESASEFDFDTNAEGTEDDEDIIEIDDEDDVDVPEDDEEIEIEDEEDDDDEEIEIIDDEEEIEENFRPRSNRRMVEGCTPAKKVFKGTANLSEAVTNKILDEVKDNALSVRILKDVKRLNEQYDAVDNYQIPVPFAGAKVDGKEMIYMTESELRSKLKTTKKSIRKIYDTYKSVNESNTAKPAYAKMLKKQQRLANILESVLALQTGKLFEDEMPSDETQNVENQNDGQVANLTAITFKVKNADDFIKVLTDNGIPSEALEKVDNGGSDEQNDEQNQNGQPQTPAPDAMGGSAPAAPQGGDMGGGNPFESLLTRLTKKNKLNEDENVETVENPFGDTDQPAEDSGVDPLNTESHDNNDEGEEVRLVDTSYAPKVRQILADVYGYSTEDFDDKLGGTIEEDGSENEEGEQKGFDKNGNQTEEDAEKVGDEETISPDEVFQGLDI